VQLLYFRGSRIDKSQAQEIYSTPFGQHAPLALKGAQFKALYKLHVGDWRLIYKIERTELVFITLAIVRKPIGSSWLPG